MIFTWKNVNISNNKSSNKRHATILRHNAFLNSYIIKQLAEINAITELLIITTKFVPLLHIISIINKKPIDKTHTSTVKKKKINETTRERDQIRRNRRGEKDS